MEIYLLRHGIAVERGAPGYPNDDRPLTDEGRKKMRRAAKGIARIVEQFDVVISSPLSRARETAEIVAKEVNGEYDVERSEALLPLAQPVEAIALLNRYREYSSILLVGHEPHLSRFATALLGGDASVFEFKKAALCRIDVAGRALKNPGLLIFHLPPKALRMLGRKSSDETLEESE